MANNIRQMYRNCQECMIEGRSKQTQTQVLPDDLVRMKVFELVGVDLMNVGWNTYLVLVDKKIVQWLCENLKRTTTEGVVSVWEEWFYKFGFPSRLCNDNSPKFCCGFSAWCKELGISHELSSVYNPESNGLVEKGVGVLKEMLKKSRPKKGKE